MLVDFRVKNYALIDELEISFQDGLNVLTGETGAGKSIIIGALEILLGARASTDLIREGRSSAHIEAIFQPEKLNIINQQLEEMGIEVDSSSLLLSRELRCDGPTRTRINGQLATAAMIKKISRFLIDIHGQHEHQSLLDSDLHIKLLDEFIGPEVNTIKDKVADSYNKIVQIKKELKEIELDDGERARQIDLLEFQNDEIEKAGLKKGELEKIYKEYKVFTNMEEIYNISGEIYNEINSDNYNESGILERLGSIMKDIERIKDYDPELARLSSGINDIYFQLESLAFELRDYHHGLEFNQSKLNQLEERLNLLNGLQRKYGKTVEDILNYQADIQKKLDKIRNQEKLISTLEKKLKEESREYYKLAEKLSQLRQKMAGKLEKRVSEELADLAMKNTVFKVDFQEKEPGKWGIDKIEFLISPNAGESLKPLVKIASGGELSRIMLALKTIIARIDQVDTLIFDEVDNGVGGKTAQLMAEKLALISRQRQVICISHLPQIASMADNHYYIFKKVEGDHTCTSINLLNYEGKKRELARMLGGVKLTETTLKHAGEMLSLADEKKAGL